LERHPEVEDGEVADVRKKETETLGGDGKVCAVCNDMFQEDRRRQEAKMEPLRRRGVFDGGEAGEGLGEAP